jgi:membrane-associated phospholipid phosphatase
VRRRPRLALAAVFVTVGSAVATQIAKLVLDSPRAVFPFGETDYPSGHMTAAAAVSLALVLVAPRIARVPAALLGTAWSAGVALSLVSNGTHRPSDVLGGALMAVAFAAPATAWPSRRPTAQPAARAAR